MSLDSASIRRLALDLLRNAAEDDSIGVQAAFLAINDLSDLDRAVVLARVDGIGARAIRELAFLWGVEPAEALRRLTAGRE